MKIWQEGSPYNSRLAVKVMESIASREEGDYGSRIAETLGKSQASVGRVISELEDEGFLEKGARKKAQYYLIDYSAFGRYWYENMYAAVKNLEEDMRKTKWLEEGTTSREEVLTGMEEHREGIERAVEEYLKAVLTDRVPEEITLSELLFESFAYSIGHNIIEDHEFLDGKPHLGYAKDAMVFTLSVVGFPGKLREVVDGSDSN